MRLEVYKKDRESMNLKKIVHTKGIWKKMNEWKGDEN